MATPPTSLRASNTSGRCEGDRRRLAAATGGGGQACSVGAPFAATDRLDFPLCQSDADWALCATRFDTASSFTELADNSSGPQLAFLSAVSAAVRVCRPPASIIQTPGPTEQRTQGG